MGENSDIDVQAPDELGGARRDLFAKIARLYYVEDMNQRQIAEQLNISVASVSRALSKAKDLNIVRISIEETREEFHKMEIDLERRYGIRECMVAGRYDSTDETHKDMASMVTGLLARLLKRDDVLGLGWGPELKGIGTHMGRASVGRVDMVPLAGVPESVAEEVGTNAVLEAFQSNLEGDGHPVSNPALYGSPADRKAAMRDKEFGPIRRLWNRIDTVITSVEQVDSKSDGIYTAGQRKQLKSLGGVGILNGGVIDAHGEPLENPFEDQLMAVEIEEIRHIRNVVLVGRGAAAAPPIRAALAGGFAHVLVIDAECAEAL